MKMIITKLSVLVFFSLLANSVFAEWHCFVADKNGHTWTSAGMSQEHASTVANSFCSAYSPNASTCHITTCSNN